MRRTSRRAAVVAAAVVTAASLSGCGAGFSAQTNQAYAPGNGGVGRAGDVRIRDVRVVVGPSQTEVTAGFVNGGSDDDALVGVTVDGKPAAIPGGSLLVPPLANVGFGLQRGNRLVVNDPTLQPGRLAEVTLTFRDAGTARVTALIATAASVLGS